MCFTDINERGKLISHFVSSLSLFVSVCVPFSSAFSHVNNRGQIGDCALFWSGASPNPSIEIDCCRLPVLSDAVGSAKG